MVEESVPQRKQPKICSAEHSKRLKLECPIHQILLCSECARSHGDHINSLLSLRTVLEHNLGEYRNIEERTNVLEGIDTNLDEIKSYVMHILNKEYEKFIEWVVGYKSKWIQTTFREIFQNTEQEVEGDTTESLGKLREEIENVKNNLSGYISSGDDSEAYQMMNIIYTQSPKYFESKIAHIMSLSTQRNELKNIEVCFNEEKVLPERIIDGLFTITSTVMNTPNKPPALYPGDIISKIRDYEFILETLPKAPTSMKLLYGSKRDGLDPSIFHQKCDGAAPTLTIIRAKNSNIFGGYSVLPWSSSGGNLVDRGKECYLFTCRNRTKHKHLKTDYPIYGNSLCGPTFGGYYEIMTNGKGSFATLGRDYEMPPGGLNQDYLAGYVDKQFELDSYEVLLLNY